MKKSSNIKRITALLLAIVMLFFTSCTDSKGSEESATGDSAEQENFEIYNETTQTVKKSETVYVNLLPDGTVRDITVSDWLHADRGNVYINDITTLKDFDIAKGHASSVNEKGEIVWQAESSDIYYEGKATAGLPVDVSIKYFLDEKEITPKDLAGKSGNFRMEISMKNNMAYEVTIDGQKHKMYSPIAAVGGMMLPYENFSDIEVTNGMSVGGGSYEMVVLTGAPGINESLNLLNLDIEGFENISFSDTFTISATVKDFVLNDAYFAFMPLSSLKMDVQLPSSLEDVKGILTELQNIQALLAQVDPNNVLGKFMSDSDAVREMLDMLQKGLKVYNENEKMLDTMTTLLTPENIATLSEFLNSLDAEEMQSLLNMMSNVPGLQSMMDSLLNLSTSMEEVMPILESFSAAMEDPEVAASLEKLPETLKTMAELMEFLNENKELLDVMTALMATEDVDKLTDILSGMSTGDLNLGNTDVSQLSEDAQELINRMELWLSLDYGIYTSAYDYMETSCTFICKSDPIK